MCVIIVHRTIEEVGMKRLLILLFSILLSVCLLSCGDGDVGGASHKHNGSSYVDDGLKVSLSSSVSAARSRSLETIDWSAWNAYIVDDITSNGKVPSYTITPSEVILDVCRLDIYDPKNYSDPTVGSNSSITIMERVLGKTPHMVNVLTSRGMDIEELSEEEIEELFTTEWNGLFLHFGPGIGRYNPEAGYDTFWGGSLVGIRLPDGVTKNQILNCVDPEDIPDGFVADEQYVWFQMQDLEPFDTDNLHFICFQTGLDAPVIINPTGLTGDWRVGPIRWSQSSRALCLPLKGGAMDFSVYEQPEIRVTFDVTDLVQLYAVPGGYRAYLNINNPYPISISCAEFDPDLSVELSGNQSEDNIATANANGCFMYRRSPGMVLNWVRPNYEDINHIEITHNTVDDEEGAELIYLGNRSQFLHEVDDVFSDHYYWIYTIGNDGRSSDGVKFRPSPY